MTKKEQIEYIVSEARQAGRNRVNKKKFNEDARRKEYKKLERNIENAKLYLVRSTEKQVEDLYNRVQKEGAEKVFS